MTDRTEKTVTFTGEEIIRALTPEIARKLSAEYAERVSLTPLEYEIVLTRWETRAVPYTGKLPVPPGTSGMTVDVEFTLVRRADREAS